MGHEILGEKKEENFTLGFFFKTRKKDWGISRHYSLPPQGIYTVFIYKG